MHGLDDCAGQPSARAACVPAPSGRSHLDGSFVRRCLRAGPAPLHKGASLRRARAREENGTAGRLLQLTPLPSLSHWASLSQTSLPSGGVAASTALR